MFWFKLCPRCSGDLFQEEDQYGSFITCMQCGLNKDVAASEDGMMFISAEPVPALVTPEPDGSKRRRISHGGRHFAKTLAVEADGISRSAA